MEERNFHLGRPCLDRHRFRVARRRSLHDPAAGVFEGDGRHHGCVLRGVRHGPPQRGARGRGQGVAHCT
eukprot:2687642-Pyramimonas_sp.AAC.1